MNTPAHVVLNLLCVGRHDMTSVITPVVVGAILPDAPMFVMYFIAKVIWRQPESVIWTKTYNQAGWQNFIDLFNSVPLMLVGLGLCWWTDSKLGMLLFISMLMHIAGDLPLHHDDAHRHFFPLSNWRFYSPVSYWDPRYHGRFVTMLEGLGVVLSCGVLFQTYDSGVGKVAIGLVGLSYVAYFAYAYIVWG
ncbi:MAG: hypothetical protein AAFW84_08630 [Cyanobacteria bacterium J06635_15]